MAWPDDNETSLNDLFNSLPVRPRPRPVLFDQAAELPPLPPLPSYQNPGAAVVPDFVPITNDPTLPPPRIGGAPASSLDRSLGGPMRAGTAGLPAAPAPTTAPTWDRVRETLGADIGGRRVSAPQIFNGGVEQDPLASLDPVRPTPLSLPQQIQRVYSSGLNAEEQAALRSAIIARHNMTQDLQNNARNMGQGLFTEAQRAGVGEHGMDPRYGGGNRARLIANDEDRTRYTTGGQQAIDQTVAAHVAANPGATADDLAEVANAVRRGRGAPAAAAPGGNWPVAPRTQAAPTDQPSSEVPRSLIRRDLDQHLGSALVTSKAMTQEQLASRRGTGSRISLTMPATTLDSVANDAITNFVSSVASDGILKPETLPEVMSYMNERFGANHTNRWFQQRFGGIGGGNAAHQEGVNTIINLANSRGGNVGYTNPTNPAENRWGAGRLGDVARTINGWFN